MCAFLWLHVYIFKYASDDGLYHVCMLVQIDLFNVPEDSIKSCACPCMYVVNLYKFACS